MRRVASAVLVAFSLVVLALIAPSQATAAQTTSAPASIDNGPCRYQVRYNWTPVQENPDTDSVVRKYKFAGDYVTGPCRSALDYESGVYFTAVDCSCASDGIGWIRSYWLR